MKQTPIKPAKDGRCRVIVTLDKGEVLMSFREEAHYRLGLPVEDVMAGHILIESERVVWDSASQKWV